MKKIITLLILSINMTFAYWNINSMKDKDFIPTGELNWRTAYFGIMASNYIYSDGLEEIDPFMSNNGFTSIQHIDKTTTITFGNDNIKVDLQASIYEKKFYVNNQEKKLIVVAFRGTEGLSDIRTDAEAGWATWQKPMVHEGFFASLNVFEQSLQKSISEKIMDKNTIVFITGHSLGGSIATLYSARLIENGKSKKSLLTYTYGAAGFANLGSYQKFANTFFLHRLYTKNDPVAKATDIYYRLTGGFRFPKGGHSSGKYYMPKIKRMYTIYNLSQVYSWNGNASIINYENEGVSQDNNVFGIEKDVSKSDPLTPNKSFNSFQWQVNTDNGKNLLIEDVTGNSDKVQVCYGRWADSEKKFCRTVRLPYVIDPTKDGYKVADGKWFIVGIGSRSELQDSYKLEVKPTNEEGSNTQRAVKLSMAIDGTHIWTGTGSLIDKSTGTLNNYGANKDMAFMVKNPKNSFSSLPVNMNSVVFFQWQVDTNNGKKIKIDSNCATKATITFGYWNTRQYDFVAHRVNLPYIINPKEISRDVKSGEWRVIKVAVEETDGNECSYEKARIYADVVK